MLGFIKSNKHNESLLSVVIIITQKTITIDYINECIHPINISVQLRSLQHRFLVCICKRWSTHEPS